MKKILIYLTCFTTALAIILLVSINSSSSEHTSGNSIQQKNSNKERKPGTDLSPPFELEGDKIAPTLTNGKKFEQCYSIVKKVNDKRLSWHNNRFEVPKKIAQKYTSDEVFVALEALQLSSSTYLDKQLETSLKQLAVEQRKQKLGQDYPDEFRTITEKGYKVVDMTRFFERFLDVREAERISLAESIPLLANDVEKIFDSTFSEDEIIEILSYIDNVESPFENRVHLRDFRLIDVAASRGMLKVFNYLIERGVKVENRPSAMNTLEIVIFRPIPRFYRNPESSNSGNFQQIIQTLLSYELPVRIREGRYRDNLIVGGAGQKNFFAKPSEEKEDHFRNFGVDLTKRITQEYFLQESNSELVKALEEHANQELFGEVPNGKQGAEDCQAFLGKVQRLINKHDIQQVLNQVSAENGGLSDKIIPILNQMEPALVDVYMALEETPAPPNNISFDMNSLTFTLPGALGKGDIVKAKELLQKAEAISAADTHEVFWSVVRSNIEHIGFLVENGLVPEFKDYQKAAALTPDQLKKLAEWDYLFNSVDKRGKSLAFYAAFRCNTQLVDYLYEQGFAYHTQQWGEDPLATAIRYTECSRWKGENYPENYNKKSLIRSLMKFQPEIAPHHLKRMAELKLTDVENYQEIVEVNPKLAVDDDILPSGYYVQPGEVWNGVRYQ